jgi:signal transduction histidine kinase
LLYGIKLSLDQIDLQSPEAIDASDIAFDEAKRVLSRCIKECRRISNELMPSALEYFGLVPAIEDLCKQVKGPIDLKSNITGLHGRLPKYLEVVIYRIVQELTKNVVKHAAATKALINVSFKGDEVTIKVEDNGVGFSAVKVPDGRSRIRSIDNKLHLLKGKLHTARVPGGGTLVSVQFSIKGLVA